jgi:hypothetical protein
MTSEVCFHGRVCSDEPPSRRLGCATLRPEKCSWTYRFIGLALDGTGAGRTYYGMEHICHHEPNSILIVWLLIALAMVIERLYSLSAPGRTLRALRPAIG